MCSVAGPVEGETGHAQRRRLRGRRDGLGGIAAADLVEEMSVRLISWTPEDPQAFEFGRKRERMTI